MKRILLVTFVFSLSGCMSGTVGVQQSGSNPGGSTPPAVSSQGSRSTSGTIVSSTAEGAVANAKVLFFATERSAALGTPAGLNFLSVDAQSNSPFGFYFQGAPTVSVDYWKPVVMDGREEVAWIQHAGSGFFLETMNTNSMEQGASVQVLDASSWALSDDARLLAGVARKSGKLFVQNLGSRLTTYSSNQFSSQAKVQWIGTQRIAVVDSQTSAVTVFSKADPTSSTINLQGEGFTASPSGKVMLLFSKCRLQKIDPASGAVLASYALGLTSFESPKWNGESQVAFVDSPDTGLQVTVFDVAAGHVVSQIPVSAPAEQIQSVCPAWVRGNLYFAGQNDQGLWSIWQTTAIGFNPSAIVNSEDPMKHYVCPQGVSP